MCFVWGVVAILNFLGRRRAVNALLAELDKKLRHAFGAIREEMDEHRQSINENTEELQEHGKALDELEQKLDALSEQLGKLSASLDELKRRPANSFTLSTDEQKVFLVLYATEHSPLNPSGIMLRTKLSSLAVKAAIFSLINKGIPIVEKAIDGQSYFSLDKKFRERQAKEKIVSVDEGLIQEIKL